MFQLYSRGLQIIAFYFVGKDIRALQENDKNHEACPIYTNITDYESFAETLLTMFRTAMNGFNVRITSN